MISVSSAVFQTFRVTSDGISDSTRVNGQKWVLNDERSRKAKTMKGK